MTRNDGDSLHPPRSGHIADQDHVQRVLSGDMVSFTELIERHQSTVFAVALAITSDQDTANDVCQDTFVSAWRGVSSLRDQDRIGPWLNGIARNLANNATRKLAREHRARRAAQGPNSIDLLNIEEREDARRIFAILRELPAQYRIPLVLYYQEERSVADLAELLELSQSAVKKRLERGRALIKDDVLGKLRTTLGASRVRAGLGVAVLAVLGSHEIAVASSTTRVASNATLGATAVARYVFGLMLCALVGFGLFYSLSGQSAPNEPERQSVIGRDTSSNSLKQRQGEHLRASKDVEADHVEPTRPLDPAHPAVHLHVTDLSGGPIMGAQFDDKVRDLIVGQTNANGLLRVGVSASLAGAFHQVEVRAQGYAKKDVILAGYGQYEIRMIPESTLSGRVFSPEMTPLAGVRVTAFARAKPGLSESIVATVAGPDGRFHLSGLAPGRHQLLASGEGWTLSEERTVELGLYEAEQVELVMTSGVSVSGHLDTRGTPFSEGLVVEARSEEHPNYTATVARDGGFRFTALSDGEYELVVRQISIVGRRKVHVDGKAIGGVTLDVGSLHSQRIVAREANGAPIAAVDITARQYIDDLVQLHRCTTDENGVCEIFDLPKGMLSKVRPSILPKNAAQSVSLPSERSLEFVLAQSGGISGRAVGRDGDVLAYKVVSVTVPGARRPHGTVLTDAKGRYNFRRLPVGSYELRVFPTSDFVDPMVGLVQSCGGESIEVSSGVHTTLDLRTDLRLAVIDGVVVDRSGAVVPEALVTYAVNHERHGTFDGRYGQIAVADAAGQFQLKDIPVGPSLRILAQGRDGFEGMVIGVSAGDAVTVTLETVTE